MNKIGGRIGKLTVKRTSSIFLLISFVTSTTTASVNETPPDPKRGSQSDTVMATEQDMIEYSLAVLGGK